jgi:leucyl aminopeptidase
MPSDALEALVATTAPAADVETDVLIVPAFEQDEFRDLPDLDGATAGELRRMSAAGEFTGRLHDVVFVPLSGWRARRLVLIGAGRLETCDTERLRKAATVAGLALRKRRIERVAFVVRGVEAVAGAQAAIEGLTLAEFSAAFYRKPDGGEAPAREVHVVASGADDGAVRTAVERGRVLGESSNLARALCNEPANILTPRVFADRAAEIGGHAGLEVEILDEHEIARRGMGLLLGVARGSSEPPRVIVLRHDPPDAPDRPVLGLVGKGITFDTGGISIKPAEGMDRMKDDMAGGAAVLTAMRAMSLLKSPMRVVGVIPSTENMPGGRALKPGDVLTAASGKTVEVNNTDAEGRLILGDGLWLAQQLGATHLVDVATLTGACMVALGNVASGIFGTPEPWLEHVRQTALRAGDRCWPLPIYEEYVEQLRSEIADMVNSGGRPAGAITAALFVKEFTQGLPWVHIDIAGTAWADEAKAYRVKGPTGVAVRALAELAFTTFPI